MKNVLILSDIDGVVANAVEPVLGALWREFAVMCSYADVTDHDMPLCLWPAVMHVFRDKNAFKAWLWKRVWSNAEAMSQCPPYWDMIKLYRELIKSGVDIHFVTARSSDLLSVTRGWLMGYGIGKEISFRSNATKGEQYRSIAMIAWDVRGNGCKVRIVEDHVVAAEEANRLCMNDHLHDVQVLVPERPWSKEYWVGTGLKKRYVMQELEELL